MHLLAGVVLLVHGVAHLVGFVAGWRFMAVETVPPMTTLLAGRISLGPMAARSIGMVWLLLALLFVASAAGATLRTGWWPRLTVVVACASLILCVASLPEAKVGVALNAALLLALFAGSAAGWEAVR